MRMNVRRMDIVFTLIFICMFTGAFWVSLKFEPPVLRGDPGAAFFPQMISIASLFFCVVLLVQRLSQIKSESDQQANKIVIEFRPFFVTGGFVAGLILAMHYFGSEIAFFIFLFVLLGMRTKRWLWALIVSFISTAIVYIVFVALLNVHLPVLFLPQYINF